MEVSAKTGENVKAVFAEISRRLVMKAEAAKVNGASQEYVMLTPRRITVAG